MKNIFETYSPQILLQNKPYELGILLNIIEEYMLIELLDSSSYMNILKIAEEKYELTLKADQPFPELYDLKNACLSLTTTLLLIILGKEAYDDVKVFEVKINFAHFISLEHHYLLTKGPPEQL